MSIHAILMVEDDPNDVELTRLALTEFLVHYELVITHNGAKALDYIFGTGKYFTSSKEERDLIEGYQFGANAYVRKPIQFDEFNQAIRNLGLFWIQLNQTPPQAKETSIGKKAV